MPTYYWVPPEDFMPGHIYEVNCIEAVADNEVHAVQLIRQEIANNIYLRHKLASLDDVLRVESLRRICTGTVSVSMNEIYDWDAYKEHIEKYENIKLRFD